MNYEKEAMIDKNFADADAYEEMEAGRARIAEDQYWEEHGTQDTCVHCGHIGIQEISFAEPGCCHICIKRGLRSRSPLSGT